MREQRQALPVDGVEDAGLDLAAEVVPGLRAGVPQRQVAGVPGLRDLLHPAPGLVDALAEEHEGRIARRHRQAHHEQRLHGGRDPRRGA
ncbi:MAG: hypothetical protein LW860_09980 [Xanthomonadaceae bacterium]|nr:hypothetical protein [Xanthomonadaceae bacterium]